MTDTVGIRATKLVLELESGDKSSYEMAQLIEQVLLAERQRALIEAADICDWLNSKEPK